MKAIAKSAEVVGDTVLVLLAMPIILMAMLSLGGQRAFDLLSLHVFYGGDKTRQAKQRWKST